MRDRLEKSTMPYAKLTTVALLAAAITATACNRTEPAEEPAREDNAAAEVREREREAAELEKRVIDVEQRWNEMQAEVKEEARTPTAALQAEVKEDVANVKQAVAALKTTSADNWWERHEEATERTIDDVEADVRRFTKATITPAPAETAEPVGTTAGFEDRRDQFVARVRARIDALEEALARVKADGPNQTELEDTRARIDKLQDDLDRLRNVSPDEWWDVSSERVSEYIDRLERSIGRLNDDKTER
jgi:DNA repair exonuclease SbcCD ATPase subunit